MTNLSGFCAADPTQCAFGATPPPIQPTVPPTPAQITATANAGPYRTVAQTITQGVTDGLYRIAAAVGKNFVCPSLPVLGAAIGGSVQPTVLTPLPIDFTRPPYLPMTVTRCRPVLPSLPRAAAVLDL